MTTPTTVSESARVRVRAALADALRDPTQWQAMPESQRRNLLLDAVGSDHRPLVDLLLFAEARGVPERLPAGPLDGDRWELLHAHAALDFASRTFVQIDAARWVVEAWAFATDRITVEQLERRHVEVSETRVSVPVPTAATRVPTAQPPARRPSVAAQVLPAPAAAVVHRILPPGPRWRTQAAPTAARHLASRGSATVVDPMATVIAVVLLIAVPGIIVLTMTPERSGRTIAPVDVVPPMPPRATPGTVAPPVPQSVSAANDAAPRVARAVSPGDIRAHGVGGTYRLIVQGVDVAGSASCDAVQRGIVTRSAPIEVVRHLPGSDRITFGSEGQLVGRIEADGRFTTDRAHGATRGVQWSVQWSGVFDGDSLIAISESETTGVLRWREAQSCRTITRLVGHRLPSTAAP